jgi:hypothetical protein
MKWPFVILWRLIFGPPPGNYVGCLDNDELEEELDAIAEFERETA